MKLRFFVPLAALAISLLGPTVTRADTKMAMTDSKMATSEAKMSKAVYVCKACKTYYSAETAKKMNNKDKMGHKLVKMAKAPAGYKDGEKMAAKTDSKMGGKMDSKMGGKMDSKMGGKM